MDHVIVGEVVHVYSIAMAEAGVELDVETAEILTESPRIWKPRDRKISRLQLKTLLARLKSWNQNQTIRAAEFSVLTPARRTVIVLPNLCIRAHKIVNIIDNVILFV